MKIYIEGEVFNSDYSQPIGINFTEEEALTLIDILKDSLKYNLDNGDHFAFQHEFKGGTNHTEKMIEELRKDVYRPDRKVETEPEPEVEPEIDPEKMIDFSIISMD